MTSRRRQRNAPTIQDLADTLDRIEILFTERDQDMIERDQDMIERDMLMMERDRLTTERDRIMTERFNRVDTAVDELTNFVRVNLQRAQDTTAGNRISRPSYCYGKEGFLRFVRTYLPEAVEHETLYQCVSRAALVSAQVMRDEHPELRNVRWRQLHHNYKLEMTEYTFDTALEEYNILEIIRQCPDFWPCMIVVERKWTYLQSYGQGRR
ncbi:hypothetical protein HPULCUR_004814 [Helicostylum pulchrum]|uniref:Uncharacterized protein n=1 Tax=Helicostylum pulchrum TaxID=562976 RepID=A0ABP9XXB6_9FUNG